MISDISNAESGSDVDDFGSFFQKGVDYGYLTPVHEEVRGTDSLTYYSCDDQTRRDIAPESCKGVQATGMVQNQLPDNRQPSTNRNPHDSGISHSFSFAS
jgi:hypothetical protein